MALSSGHLVGQRSPRPAKRLYSRKPQYRLVALQRIDDRCVLLLCERVNALPSSFCFSSNNHILIETTNLFIFTAFISTDDRTIVFRRESRQDGKEGG